MNAQEIDVYVALPSGAYRYDAAAHALQLVAGSDLRRVTGYQDFVDEAALALGGLDGLVNSAGAALIATLMATPMDEFDKMWDLNVRATLVCIQQAVPHMRSGGSIVNIGSDAGLRGEQSIGAYSVSKAALVMMTRLVALDLAGAGIRCNVVCPGATLPGMRHIGHVAKPAEGPQSLRGRQFGAGDSRRDLTSRAPSHSF